MTALKNNFRGSHKQLYTEANKETQHKTLSSNAVLIPNHPIQKNHNQMLLLLAGSRPLKLREGEDQEQRRRNRLMLKESQMEKEQRQGKS